MSPPRISTLPFLPPSPGWRDRGIAVGVGVGCAAAILSVLAATRFDSSEEAKPEEAFVVRRVSVPLDAPPPIEVIEVPVAVGAVGPLRLEIAAAPAGALQIQVPEDAPLLRVEESPPPARPSVDARFDIANTSFRPAMDFAEMDSRHVFERNEVDQPPLVLQRVEPRIGDSEARGVATPRTTVLLIVNTDGSVGDLRVVQSSHDARFDRRVVEAIRYWQFSAAVRKGRKVRCWVQQSITIRVSDASPFSVH